MKIIYKIFVGFIIFIMVLMVINIIVNIYTSKQQKEVSIETTKIRIINRNIFYTVTQCANKYINNLENTSNTNQIFESKKVFEQNGWYYLEGTIMNEELDNPNTNTVKTDYFIAIKLNNDSMTYEVMQNGGEAFEIH